ncbi:MAG: S-layer homology domain-containing protein [Evtepia sp.]
MGGSTRSRERLAFGWIAGYPDGTFRPDTYITRAEAMTMINRVLCRMPQDAEAICCDTHGDRGQTTSRHGLVLSRRTGGDQQP